MAGSTAKPRAGKPRIHWPAVLTVVRVILAIPVVILTLRETRVASYAACIAFAIAALTDGLDGLAARRMGLVSSAGQFWDPIADKVLLLAALAGLVVVGRFPLWAAAVIVVRELAVTALRWRAERRGRGFAASKTAKAKTAMQLIAVLLFILPAGELPSLFEQIVLWIAVVLTVVSGLQYLRRAPVILGED